MNDDGFRLDDRSAGSEAVAGRMDLVDIVAALHFQDAGMENAVGDGILMRLGSLKKTDHVLRQRDLRDLQPGRRQP